MTKIIAVFAFGAACGAWLNIWPALLHPWGGFLFAYILVFAALGATVYWRNT